MGGLGEGCAGTGNMHKQLLEEDSSTWVLQRSCGNISIEYRPEDTPGDESGATAGFPLGTRYWNWRYVSDDERLIKSMDMSMDGENSMLGHTAGWGPSHGRRAVLRVEGIGVEGWNGRVDGKGKYENQRELTTIFKKFGKVKNVVVCHKIQNDSNASWALVTMADMDGAIAAVKAPSVLAGATELIVSHFNDKDKHLRLSLNSAAAELGSTDSRRSAADGKINLLAKLAQTEGEVQLNCEALIATYARQDFFGELAMLEMDEGPNGQVRDGTATAMRQVRLR